MDMREQEEEEREEEKEREEEEEREGRKRTREREAVMGSSDESREGQRESNIRLGNVPLLF